MPTEAEQVINIMSRDIVRAGVFAEVYSESAEGPRGGSVAPSLFGNIHLIDNVWMMNGVRMDLGEPSFVRLPSTVGGVSGLTYQGHRYSVDFAEGRFSLTGDAVDRGLLSGAPFAAEIGETVGGPVPTEPTEPTEPTQPTQPTQPTGSTATPRVALAVTGGSPTSGAIAFALFAGGAGIGVLVMARRRQRKGH